MRFISDTQTKTTTDSFYFYLGIGLVSVVMPQMQVLCLLNRDSRKVDLDSVPQFFCSLSVGVQFYSVPKRPCRAAITEKRRWCST